MTRDSKINYMDVNNRRGCKGELIQIYKWICGNNCCQAKEGEMHILWYIITLNSLF